MIIDASVALKWLIPEEGSERAAALIGEGGLIVPVLFHSELANAVWRKARAGEVRLDELAEQIGQVTGFVRTVDETSVIPRALALAGELGHPVYDCVYLALADSLDEVVVTCDRKLLRVVKSTALEARLREL